MFRRDVPFLMFFALAVSVLADPPSKPAEPGGGRPKSEAARKEPPPFPSAELAVLDRFAGPWSVRETHYNARGDTIGSAKGAEETGWMLDRKVLHRTYTTGEEGSPFRALGMITWNPVSKRYEGTWFDNTGACGPTTISGTWDESSKTMTFTLSSAAPDGKTVEHKVIDRFLDDEHRIATTFKVEGSRIEKVIEVQFSRTIPCPAKIGIIDPEISKNKD